MLLTSGGFCGPTQCMKPRPSHLIVKRDTLFHGPSVDVRMEIVGFNELSVQSRRETACGRGFSNTRRACDS